MLSFHSRKSMYKSKFGAVTDTEDFTLRILLPRDLKATQSWLVIHRDDSCKWDFIPMDWDFEDGCGNEWWKITLSLPSAGLYWYHFEYDTPFGRGLIWHTGKGEGRIRTQGEDFQLSVYSKDFSVPSWLRGGIIYQIFPDRFSKAQNTSETKAVKGRILRSDWGGMPQWRASSEGKILNNDYFCGNFKGIEEKLPYIASLGVSCIYLNPVFEAHSNHRYDTADYLKIDPLLGSLEDFSELCKAADSFGIKIILDGVFSHTGDNSIYFNKYGQYAELGAYQSKESPYYSWYNFRSFPDDYAAWWGIKTLPEINEENESFIHFTGKISDHWLGAGAYGWRLDVADELPDTFLDSFRTFVKEKNSDAVIIGEVWEDASNKYSHGGRRRYLLGKQLDSVMNYPFSAAVLTFIRSGLSEGFLNKILSILENYPKPVTDILMNHIGTHDTARVITVLAGENSDGKDREWQANQKLSPAQYKKGKELLKMAAVMQYTLPGVPSVYYGDEAGMSGYRDPFNRGCYPWGAQDHELIDWYKKLGELRRSLPLLKDAGFIAHSDFCGCVAYERQNAASAIMVIVNRNDHGIEYHLPQEWHGSQVIWGSDVCGQSVFAAGNTAVILFRNRSF